MATSGPRPTLRSADSGATRVLTAPARSAPRSFPDEGASPPAEPAAARALRQSVLFAWVAAGAFVSTLAVAAIGRSEQILAALEQDDGTTTAPAASAPSAAIDTPAERRVSSPPARATPDDIRLATAQGAPALRELARRHPADSGVLLALVKAEAAGFGDRSAAMETARRLLEIDPSAARDPQLERAIVTTATGPDEAAAKRALDLMAGPLGPRGPELLFDLVIAPGTAKATRDRASTLLADPAVRRLASPALLVALDLRATSVCGRKALLDRAREHGDGRSLALLRPMLVTTGCGMFKRTDCHPCLGSRNDVREAIAAIQQRQGAGAPERR